MTRTILFIPLAMCLTCCNEAMAPLKTPEYAADQPASKATCPVDPALVEILPYEEWLGLRAYSPDTDRPITRSDIDAAECLLIEVAKRNSEDQAQEPLSLGLERYRRQYCAMTDSTGHRFIYLNAICFRGEQPSERTGEWQVILDGGDCYFQALFDLSREAVVFFSVNGEA